MIRINVDPRILVAVTIPVVPPVAADLNARLNRPVLNRRIVRPDRNSAALVVLDRAPGNPAPRKHLGRVLGIYLHPVIAVPGQTIARKIRRKRGPAVPKININTIVAVRGKRAVRQGQDHVRSRTGIQIKSVSGTVIHGQMVHNNRHWRCCGSGHRVLHPILTVGDHGILDGHPGKSRIRDRDPAPIPGCRNRIRGGQGHGISGCAQYLQTTVHDQLGQRGIV